MRDEGAKLLTFVNTWIDGVPSNLDKSLAKWRMSFEQEEEQGRKQRNESPFDRLHIYRKSLVPVGVTNRY